MTDSAHSQSSGLVVDLFAGPGGWSQALRALGLRDVGIELEEWACKTRAAAGHLTIRADVATYPTEPFVGKTWGLIVSAPCQDFSAGGYRFGLTGQKGPLVYEVLRWANDLRPEWIACEQVPEVLPIWRAFAHELRKWGYRTWVGVLNAADFGVPQDRERAFLLAHISHPIQPPMPTHARGGVVGGMFGDLPAWQSMGPVVGRGDGWHLEHIRGAGLIERSGPRPPRYPHDVSFTVMAWKDSRMRWVHRDGRVERFGVRDSLVLQGFPEDYPVQGSETRKQEQIGNAVPPPLAAERAA